MWEMALVVKKEDHCIVFERERTEVYCNLCGCDSNKQRRLEFDKYYILDCDDERMNA